MSSSLSMVNENGLLSSIPATRSSTSGDVAESEFEIEFENEADSSAYAQAEQRMAVELEQQQLQGTLPTSPMPKSDQHQKSSPSVVVVESSIQPLSVDEMQDTNGDVVRVSLITFLRALPDSHPFASSSSSLSTVPTCTSTSIRDQNGSDYEAESDSSEDEVSDDDVDGDIAISATGELDLATLGSLIRSNPLSIQMKDDDDEEDIAQATAGVASVDYSSDMEEEIDNGGPLKTKNELLPSQLPPVEPFDIHPTAPLLPIGKIMNCVDNMIVVEAIVNLRGALDINTCVCTANRLPVARIEEVFGPVSSPFYSLRRLVSASSLLLPAEEILYTISSLSSYVLPDRTPGSDASNINDEEIDEEEREYSDDEEETRVKSKKKKEKKAGKGLRGVHKISMDALPTMQPIQQNMLNAYRPTNTLGDTPKQQRRHQHHHHQQQQQHQQQPQREPQPPHPSDATTQFQQNHFKPFVSPGQALPPPQPTHLRSASVGSHALIPTPSLATPFASPSPAYHHGYDAFSGHGNSNSPYPPAQSYTSYSQQQKQQQIYSQAHPTPFSAAAYGLPMYQPGLRTSYQTLQQRPNQSVSESAANASPHPEVS